MNFKRVSTAAMALAMTASLGSAALAADLPQGWTPADGARGPMLISTNPNAGSYDKPMAAAPIGTPTPTPAPSTMRRI